MSTALLTREYAALTDEWKAAEDARQRIVERFRALEGPLALADPIWEEWDDVDERAGSARDAVRSFLAANSHDRRG